MRIFPHQCSADLFTTRNEPVAKAPGGSIEVCEIKEDVQVIDKTEHAHVVGGDERPPFLAQARKPRSAGELGAARVQRVEDRAVDEAIGVQEAIG